MVSFQLTTPNWRKHVWNKIWLKCQNSLKLAFVIVAGTKSRDGAMWSQLTIPITRQAVQI